MFGCIYQLWDWLEAPPLFNGAMDAKKLQALQQQAGAHKKFPLAYQTNINDYHTATHSPVFSQHQQHTAPHQLAGYQLGGFQQSPTATSSSGGPLTPIDLQPQSNNKLLLKHVLAGNNSSSSSHSSPYHQSYTSSGIAAGSSDMYQSPSERTYMTSAGRTANPASALQQQYQQLQQAKLQLQLQTQNEAMQQQQRTFALRQALNPPVPQSHYHMSQSSSIVSTLPQDQLNKQHSQQAQQQQQHQRAPPSSLNLASQFQPAPGPLKMQQQRAQQQQQQQQQHYQHNQQDVHIVQQQLQLQLQHQQQLQQQQQNELQQQQQHHHLHKVNEQSPVYIQQNHPGHVVNQACQTQISAVKSKSLTQQQKATPSSEESSVKSPVHAPLDRKKSTGSVQALKSPIAKRPPASPVSLSGWLYKQGSEGLKVWRKRWFVLAEYCLYYYKGPEEEKLLGSILLPSYRVSACLPEDKIYRKFAFKCEHQNMRTYWLAAENGDAMVQWVRALTAATMMQAPSSSGDSDQTSQPSGSSSLNHSGDNSDSGIHTLKSQQSKGQVTPASENGAGTLSTTLNTSGEGNQPLYANAPPKPRRINDGGYSSPSPEHSIDAERKYQQQLKQQNMNVVRRSGIMSPNLNQQHMLPQKQHLQRSTAQQQQQQQQQPQPQQHHAIYDTRTGNVTTALGLQQPLQQYSVDNLEADLQQKMALSDEYSKSPPPPTPFNNYLEMEEQILRLQQQQQQQQKHELSAGLEDIYGERELYMQKLIRQRHLSSHGNSERRTPDAYGRSKNRIFSDYEDIYNLAQSGQHAQAALLQEAASYRRPLSPPSYDSSKHMPGLSLQYTPHQLESQTSRIRPVSSIMRPHSADFLDFEARAEAAATTVENEISGLTNFSSPALKPDVLRTPRPKSSLDINRTADSVYYSEASYAEKMRKSALYLQSPPRNLHGQQNFINPLGNSGLHTIGYENPYERAYKRHELLNEMTAGDVQSVPRLSRGAAAGTAAHIRANSARPAVTAAAEKQQAVQQQPPQLQAPVLSPSLPTQQIIQQNEQFLRSASARLPKRSAGFDEEYNNSNNNATTTTTTATATSAVGNNSQVGNILGGANANSNIQPDGEKKREESMKRLLEWKQRMLQSPLTRKGVQQQQQQQQLQQNGNGNSSNNKMSSLSKLGSNPNILLSSTTVASGAFYNQANLNNVASNASGNASAAATAAVSGLQRSRSETQANATYNSYSSDDEVGKVKQSPAGRSTTTTSTKTDTTTTTSTIKSSSCSTIASGINKRNTIVPTIAFIGLPTTTTLIPTRIQISEPLKKSSAIITTTAATATTVTTTTTSTINKQNPPSTEEAFKTPKILKSILKTNEILTNTKQNIHQEEEQQQHKLHLQITKQNVKSCADLEHEVDIKPKKSAPKSPQITSYIPVYTTKSLTSGSPVKNNENVESVEVSAETESATSTNSNENIIEVATKNATIEGSSEDTPMIANLMIYKEIQDNNIETSNKSTEFDRVETLIEPQIVEVEQEMIEKEADDSDTACEEYTDDDLDEALADEADGEEDSITSVNKPNESKTERSEKNVKDLSLQIYVNEQFRQNEEIEQNVDESHYLPMTPKRIDFGQSGNLSLHNLNDSNAEEENPYVEMTKFLQDEESKTSYEVMCLGRSQFMLNSKVIDKLKQHEPVYMELPGSVHKNTASSVECKPKESASKSDTNLSTGKSILKKCKKGGDTLKKKVKKTSERVQNKRKDLPDILKPPQSSINVPSDSSDADDESSKYMEGKKMRSRTRFSLSDTFRPASYYLGPTGLDNCAESSDSEVVKSNAAASVTEELKTEEIFSSEIYDTVKRRDSNTGCKLELNVTPLPNKHSSNISLNLPKSDTALKCSRLSLPDQFSKTQNKTKTPAKILLKQHERTLSDSNYSFQTDNSSNTSSDFDLYNKLKLNSPSFVVTPLRYQSNSSLPRKYSTNAPARGDSSETDSVELRHPQTSDSELEKQRSRRPLSQESINEIELLNEKFEERIAHHDLDSYLSNLQTSDLQVYQNSTFEAATNLIKPPDIFRNEDDENFYGNINFASSTDSLSKVETEKATETTAHNITPTSTDQEQLNFYTPMHSRNNSNISEQSVPYYYSELTSSREILVTPTTLNNQREIPAQGSNIEQIHNPIQKPGVSVEMLTDKYQTIDSKNICQSNVEKLNYSAGKTLKNVDNSEHVAHTTNTSHKQHVIKPSIKLSNFNTNQHSQPSPQLTCATAEQRQAKSTNLTVAQTEHVSGGGIVDTVEISSDNVEAHTKSTSKFSSFLGVQNSGELLWEEDTLWRESLRKVSQRHAKSLDDLDRIAPSVGPKRENTKAKITREVTYVNDHVPSTHLRANLNKSLNESTLKNCNAIENERLNEHDVYVQLMQQNIDQTQAEKPDELYELLREDTSSTISHKSGEIDRETIRQWDAMSSGATTKNVPSSNSSNNNTETGTEASSEISTTASTSMSVQAIVQHLNSSCSDKNGNNGGGVLKKSPMKH